MRSLPGAKCFVTGSYLGGKLPVQRLEGEGRGQSSLWSEQCELSVWRAVSGSEPHQQAPQAAGPWRLGRSAVHAGLFSLLGQLPRQLLTSPGHCVHVMAQDAGNLNCPCFMLNIPLPAFLLWNWAQSTVDRDGCSDRPGLSEPGKSALRLWTGGLEEGTWPQCFQNTTTQALTQPSLSSLPEEEEMEILWSSVFTERLRHAHRWMHIHMCAHAHINRCTHLSTHDMITCVQLSTNNMHTCAHSSRCTHTHTHAHPLNIVLWISSVTLLMKEGCVAVG